jgi:hypothetical protein
MKTLLALVALGTLIAAPALAQHAPNVRHEGYAAHQQRSHRVAPYAPGAPDIYYEHSQEMNSNLNPDFQLGGER